MFSSNDTPDQDYRLAAELGAIINLDDLTMIDTVERLVGIPKQFVAAIIRAVPLPLAMTSWIILATPNMG